VPQWATGYSLLLIAMKSSSLSTTSGACYATTSVPVLNYLVEIGRPRHDGSKHGPMVQQNPSATKNASRRMGPPAYSSKQVLLQIKTILSALFLFGVPSMFPSSVRFWCVHYDLFSGSRPCVVRQRCHRWSVLCGSSCRCSGPLTVPMSFVSGTPTMPSLVRPRWVRFVAACGV
jgi:hypothetical protein